MKATLEFNLPEDQAEYDLCNKAYLMEIVITEMNEWLRSQTKYAPDDMHPERYNALVFCRGKFHKLINEYNLEI